MPSGMSGAAIAVLVLAVFLAIVYAGAIMGIVQNFGQSLPFWALLLVAGLLGVMVVVGGMRAVR
jgi:hypothetical protein